MHAGSAAGASERQGPVGKPVHAQLPGASFAGFDPCRGRYRGASHGSAAQERRAAAEQHLLIYVGRQVANVQVGREGVAVVEGPRVTLGLLPAGALLTAQALPLLARLLLPGQAAPAAQCMRTRSVPRALPPLALLYTPGMCLRPSGPRSASSADCAATHTGALYA